MNISIEKWVKKTKMPLVTTDDGSLCFLIDTGASYNVLIREAFDSHKGIFKGIGHDNYMIGMDGDPQKIFMVNGDIKLDGEIYSCDFCVMDLTTALKTVRILTGQRIDGALGVDFLCRYGMTLDFKNYSLRG